MVATTRSRRGGFALHSSKDDPAEASSMKATKAAVEPMAPSSTKDKICRKPPPKTVLRQQTFPPRAKTVRAKKTAAAQKRLSLPNLPTVGKGTRKVDEAEDRKQKTLTQMQWVPSTHPSGDEGIGVEDSDEESLMVDLSAMTEASAAASVSNKTSFERKKKAMVKKATNRGRKRRKTTGDLELELELEEEDEDEHVSSSRYHTQTLTQMPSWQGLADMVEDSDEDLGFGLEDELLQVGDEERQDLLCQTPQSKKRKRPSPPPPLANPDPSGGTVQTSTLLPDHSASHAQLPPQAPESTNPSVVPETPHHRGPGRTEIPSSQPSPFTPNLELRYMSPLNPGSPRRSPLKERSTNLEAPAPTPSALRRRLRSEIPDSWSTVNGGMPSSHGSVARRTPLREIHLVDYSIELGESSGRPSQRTLLDIIKDSDEEFEELSDDDGVQAPGTPTPQMRLLQQPVEGPTMEAMGIDDAALSPSAKLDAAASSTSAVATATERQAGKRPAEVSSSALEEPKAATPAEQVIVPEEVTSRGLPSDTDVSTDPNEMQEVLAGEDGTPTPSVRPNATQHAASLSDALRRPVPRSSAEVVATAMASGQKAPTEHSRYRLATERKPTPEPPTEDDDTEAATPSRRRRRPSSSSVVEKGTPLCSAQKPCRAMPAVSQLGYTQPGHTPFGYKSQAFESQRVPFEMMRQWAPQTDRSDVLVAADVDEVKHIVDGTCTYLFRDFRIPVAVSRIWIYITAPMCQLKYMAAISDFRLPEEMDAENKGMGIAEFAKGSSTKYAYELLQVYQLNNPVPLARMQEEEWVEQAPSAMRVTYIPPSPLGALMSNLRCALFEEPMEEMASQGSTTISQELAQQLRSDMEHSTPISGEKLATWPPGGRRPRQSRSEPERDEEEKVFLSSQEEAADGMQARPLRTTLESTEQVVFAKPKAPATRAPHQSMGETEDHRRATRHWHQSQSIIKSTVRPSQATTMSDSSPSQHERRVEWCTIPDSPSPGRPGAAAGKADSLGMEDSPMQTRSSSRSGVAGEESYATQSSLGLAALLRSSQGVGLAGLGPEQDSLMDESKIKLPPAVEEVDGWDSDGEDL